MGRLIKVKANEIIPSQDFVKEDTIGYILKCIVNNEEEKLPPTPIVRNNPNGPGYIAIDGHNLIIISDLLERDRFLPRVKMSMSFILEGEASLLADYKAVIG